MKYFLSWIYFNDPVRLYRQQVVIIAFVCTVSQCLTSHQFTWLDPCDYSVRKGKEIELCHFMDEDTDGGNGGILPKVTEFLSGTIRTRIQASLW